MHQEIVEKAKAAQKETNPGAQHKALLDWGEALLNLCVGLRIGRDNELITICRIEGRTEILDHIIISQTWLSQNPDWELMDNDGKIREDYFEGSKIFGIEWSKQINSSPNSNSEIQSALSEASSLLTQFDEVNSENKFNSNANANS